MVIFGFSKPEVLENPSADGVKPQVLENRGIRVQGDPSVLEKPGIHGQGYYYPIIHHPIIPSSHHTTKFQLYNHEFQIYLD